MERKEVMPDDRTWDYILAQWVEQKNLEMCMQDLQTIFDRGIAPSLNSMSKVIYLAAELGYPRLALDLINAYEEGDVERMPPHVWFRLLVSAVEQHYVRSLNMWVG